ncbi:sialate O-acetylesterase [Singulisphaera sp. GP187]|uniref:sialate O-acetylesterase n=1 Tax=Singulisphaera sp. GP187 TaxID=1882752 RepID=UPI00092A5CDB|nr:sialate O-acetylesterase [Singulisphaera sp. GP187]SIO28598.1 sialate O-acetylesterase [Singulisphaera sp. GP187]
MTCSDSPRPRRTSRALALLPVLGLALVLPWPVASLAQAQAVEGKPAETSKGEPAAKTAPSENLNRDSGALEFKPDLVVKGPVDWQVYQRGEDGFADIPIVLSEDVSADSNVSVTLHGINRPSQAVAYRDGKLVNVPVGGPYQINVTVQAMTRRESDIKRGMTTAKGFTISRVYVGDLWVLAGQSNMQGVGNLTDVTPPLDRVMALGMDGKWVRAEEPLHWLVDSPDPVHSGNPDDRAARSKAEHQNRPKGAGLGLPFGVALSAATNVPVGLVVCAHGGTSMEQWDPAKKDEGGNSLYGSMLRQIQLAGGKVRGILWYQGESDAMQPAAAKFADRFTKFIGAVRADLGQPDLPFYYVQIGRFVISIDPQGWNIVRDAQRLIPDQVPGTAVVTAIDLELDDLIHVGTPGLKRLGARLARIAQRELFGQVGGTTPTLDHVSKRAGNTLVLKFKGVNRPVVNPRTMVFPIADGRPMPPSSVTAPIEGLRPARHIGGFSIRKDDGTEIPLIFDAAVGPLKDTVVLKLEGAIPAGAQLWYGYGLNPYCNLVDALDMAVPAFGPIALDEVK